jgi:hypothetical protein
MAPDGVQNESTTKTCPGCAIGNMLLPYLDTYDLHHALVASPVSYGSAVCALELTQEVLLTITGPDNAAVTINGTGNNIFTAAKGSVALTVNRLLDADRSIRSVVDLGTNAYFGAPVEDFPESCNFDGWFEECDSGMLCGLSL